MRPFGVQYVLVLYPRLRVQLYGYRRLRTRSRSSTAYGCPVCCILVQSAVPVSVPVVLWEYGLLRTSHFASHIRLYWYRYRYSQYWSNRSTRMSALALRRCCGSRLAVAHLAPVVLAGGGKSLSPAEILRWRLFANLGFSIIE